MNSKFELLQDLYLRSGQSPEKQAYYIDYYLFPESVRGMRLLDIGGGNGTVALWLHLKRGAKVDVLDEFAGHGGSSANRDILDKHLRILDLPEMEIIVADFRNARIPDNSYDSVYTRNCLHHVFESGRSRDQDVVGAMKLFHKWLKPGGRLVIGEIGWMLFLRLIPPLQYKLFPNVDFRSKSSFRRWKRCAEGAGFSFTGVRWYVPYFLRYLRGLLGNEIANVFLRASYVLVMRKPLAWKRNLSD